MRFSVIASGVVAAVVGFGSTLALVVGAAQHVGATQAQATSWITSLCLGMAGTSTYLSLRYRMPIVTAWSLAAMVLILAAPPVPLGDAIGAFILSGALMVLAGAVPALGELIGRIPASIAGGMLAGLLLRFALSLFTSAQASPGLVLPLLAVFLLARQFHPASAPLVAIVVSLPLAWLEGFSLSAPPLSLSTLVWMAPTFSPRVLVGLGIPLFLVTMATQQISGAAVLRISGYVPPMRPILLVTGLTTVAMAPLGAYSINLSSVTAAICTGEDTHPDPGKRWQSALVFSATYVVLAALGTSLVSAISALPPVLVTTVVGVALLGPLVSALTSAVHREAERFAAVLAFAVTASGMALAGIGSAFWGLLAGIAALGLERMMGRIR